MPEEFIRALLIAKSCAAKSNAELEQIPSKMADAIVKAVESVSRDDLMTHFPVDVFQTGSGTSTNMNANEVLANVATNIYQQEHPDETVGANDHINYGQSSNVPQQFI